MPDFTLGAFGKASRRHLFVAVCDLSDWVFSLRPLSLNGSHPRPPARLESTLRAMVKEGSPLTKGCKLAHLLFMSGAAPLLDGCLKGHTAPVMCLKLFSHHAVSSGDDGSLRLWDLRSHTCVRTLAGHRCPVTALDVFGEPGEGMFVLSASASGELKVSALPLEEASAGEAPAASLCTLKGHVGAVACCTVYAEGARAVSGGADSFLKVWCLVENKCLQSVKGHEGGVTCCATYAGGSRLITGGDDAFVKVFALSASGAKLLETWGGHEAKAS